MDIELILPTIHTPVLVMKIEPEHISVSATQTGGILVFQATIQRGEVWENIAGSTAPTLLDLHGIFSRSNASNSIGMPLSPSEHLPLTFPIRQTIHHLELQFALSREYVTRFEEERTWQQPGKDTTFAVRLWGVLAVGTSEAVNGQLLNTFNPIRSGATVFQIPHSTWLDILKRIGISIPSRDRDSACGFRASRP